MSGSDQSGFGKFVPGFEFMQNLARQASGGLTQGVSQLPQLGSWVAPTFSVEDLDKRIQELKAVHFWLDQNSRALSATIQALEVQKMTLSTLQGMNLSMGDVANALKVKATDAMASFAGMGGAVPEPAPAPAAAPTPFAGLEIPPRRGAPVADAPAAPPAVAAGAPQAAPSPSPAPAPASGVVDPMQWWGALTQQFQSIAANALKDAGGQAALDAGQQMATAFTQEALKAASGAVAQTAAMARPAKKSTPVKPAAGAKPTAKARAAAQPTPPAPPVRAAARPSAPAAKAKAPKPAAQPPAKAARKPAPPARPR
jgi:hypothetical protein